MEKQNFDYIKNTWSTEDDEDDTLIDTSEKILRLNDRLSEDIILESLGEQLDSEVNPLSERINYVSLFKEKYDSISETDADYDKAYLEESLSKISNVIGAGMLKHYGVELGEDLDFTTPSVYFSDMETLYEFLFIRHFENLLSYMKHKLITKKEDFLKVYRELMSNEKHSKDLFVLQSKKKFKNFDDVIIIHFMSEIINDIKDNTISAYDLFTEICNLDIYEEYNNRMSELLINYGNKIVLNNDRHSAELYLKPLENRTVFSEIRNNLLLSYLEDCELED